MLQHLAYQWLGRWYEEIDQDYKNAQHCYERAVALDDDDIIAGRHCFAYKTLNAVAPAGILVVVSMCELVFQRPPPVKCYHI